MAKDKIMPGLGCLTRRRYLEQRQKGKTEPGATDPCLMCEKRSNCVKSTVSF
jgi:hypothetical protein